MPSQLSLPFEPEHSDTPEILVIGDYLEDWWYECDSIAISAEAPVPVVKTKNTPRIFAGGAGNVASNLDAMGWRVHRVFQPDTMRKVDDSVPLKKRYVYQDRQVFRVDEYDHIPEPIVKNNLSTMLAYATSRGLPVVVADYAKGALTDELRERIYPADYSGVPHWYVHTKLSPHEFAGGDSRDFTFFYNQKEFYSFDPNDALSYECIVTQGANGAGHWNKDGLDKTVNAPIPSPVRSTCGAGDVFMAAYVTAKELYGHPNPLLIADAIAKKTVGECQYTCCVKGPIL